MENVNENLRKKFSKRLGMKKIISNILAVVCICSLISYCFFRLGSKEIDELKEYISRIEQELKSSQEQNTLLQNDILALQMELGRLREELTSLNGELAEQREYINELQEKVALLEAKVYNLMGKNPEFIETAPVYVNNKDYIKYFTLENEKNSSITFDRYVDYCRENFLGYKPHIWLLKPVASQYDYYPLLYRKYQVLCETIENNIPQNIIFNERLDMYVAELGREYDYVKGEGGQPISVALEIFIKPSDNLKSMNSIRLKFGQLQEDVYLNKYINLYYLNDCFATCYYASNVKISERWFYLYFENYFVYLK